ncbi:MAG TPA: coproporphyrinogen III oxidase, partial [Terriglobia bacterium]|nr:coproporphyrinogen III oxidase [Terriglobia bacterium]
FEVDEKSRLGSETLRHGTLYSADAVPGDDFQAEAYERARELLAGEGYAQYEISNFALPGFESHHNQGYWQLKPYLGFGAGAHSFDGTRRWVNEISPEVYCDMVEKCESPIADSRTLSQNEQVEEFFFLGLRQRRGVDLEQARGKWGNPPWNWWQARASALKQEGWLEEDCGWLRLSQRAFLVSNEVFQEFLE